MSEMRIKKRERQASPSPERLPERKKPKAKVNDKIRIPINTNTTNVKSALRIKDLADRWIKQMGSIGRVIDGDYSALVPSWKEEIMYDFLLPLLHTILKYIPHKSHFFEAMEECAYWLLHEYCRSTCFHMNHDTLALVIALVLLSGKSENHPLRIDHMVSSIQESRVLGTLFGISREREHCYVPSKPDIYDMERHVLEMIAFNLQECPHPLRLCYVLQEYATKNESSPWKWFRQRSFVAALIKRLKQERGALGIASAGRALSGELAILLSCFLIEITSVSGSDPRVADDLQALEIKCDFDALNTPWKVAGQEVLSLLINPRGPALLLSHRDRRDEMALHDTAAKLARTVIEGAVGTATVEAWVKHVHQEQHQQHQQHQQQQNKIATTTTTATTTTRNPVWERHGIL